MSNNDQVTLPIHQSEKDGLVYVRTESDYIHSSFITGEGKVIVYESIPGNVPETSLAVFDDQQQYLSAVEGVSWLNDPEYIKRNNIKEKGFPFCT